MVTIDNNVIVRQGNGVNYSFANDATISKLEVKTSSIELNDWLEFGAVTSGGYLSNVLTDYQHDYIRWVASSTNPSATVTYTISGLQASTFYQVYRDNSLYDRLGTDSLGTLSFVYSGSWSSHTFLISKLKEVVGPGLTASFTVKVTGMTVTFTDTSQGTGIVGWFWDFGDGYGSTAQNPTHTYALPGVYKVTLSVIDQNGATVTVTKTVIVGQGASWLFGNTNIFIVFALLFVAFIIFLVSRRPAGVAVALILILISLAILIWS
jgi:PKD repeat protein